MLHLHIDTAALGIPGVGIDRPEVFEASLNRLLWLSHKAPDLFDKVTISKTALKDLYVAGHYPTMDEVLDWINVCGIGEKFSSKDVWNLMNRLLTASPVMAELHNVEVLDCDKFSSTPDFEGADDIQPQLKKLTQNAFASVRLSNHTTVPGLRLLCSYVGLMHGKYEINFNCSKFLADLDGNYSTGSNYSGSVVCIDEERPFKDLNPIEIWESTKRVENLHLAISIKAKSLLMAAGKADEVPPFLLGSQFLDSLERNQGMGKGAYSTLVLEACARILAGDPKNPINEFRGENRRDEKGFRTHLTKARTGMRLMLWKTANGVEFANVGPKNELKIEHGEAAACYSAKYSF